MDLVDEEHSQHGTERRVSDSRCSHEFVIIGAQEFLDCRPYATTVFTGVDDTLTAKSISIRIDEFIGTTADSSIGPTVRFFARFLPATF